MMAAVALMMASGALGHTAEITAVAQRGASSGPPIPSRRRTCGSGSAACTLRACRLTGRIDECQRAARCWRRWPRHARPGVRQPGVPAGPRRVDARRAARARCKLLHEALAVAPSTTAWRRVAAGLLSSRWSRRTPSSARRTPPRRCWTRPAAVVKPDFLFMQTALAVATGWALAAAGSLTDAIDTVLTEAKVARDRGPAHPRTGLSAGGRAVGRRRPAVRGGRPRPRHSPAN